MSRRHGFTLIELMIVIAIIAIIAAIAIPGLLQSQRASNERSASTSLKTLASAEADFRSNDRDANKVTDFWTGNVHGLFDILPVGDTLPIKLVELSLAGADTYGTSGIGGQALISTYITIAPKAGFWYMALNSDNSEPGGAVSYKVNTNGTSSLGAGYNTGKFGFVAYPDSMSAGKVAFILNEGNTTFRKQLTANVRSGSASPPAADPTDTDLTNWPTDSVLKSNFSKLD